MKVAIVGSRNYEPLREVIDFVETLPLSFTIVSGGARGVDMTAESTARGRGMKVISFRPVIGSRDRFYVDRHEMHRTECEILTVNGPYPVWAVAAFQCNQLIVQEADRVVAFWDGVSEGTRHTIALAERSGHPAEVFLPGEGIRPTFAL